MALYRSIKLRIWLYKQHILRVKTLGCQVISVGNLTVGGAGRHRWLKCLPIT